MAVADVDEEFGEKILSNEESYVPSGMNLPSKFQLKTN
jgi:hypothetical protein